MTLRHVVWRLITNMQLSALRQVKFDDDTFSEISLPLFHSLTHSLPICPPHQLDSRSVSNLSPLSCLIISLSLAHSFTHTLTISLSPYLSYSSPNKWTDIHPQMTAMKGERVLHCLLCYRKHRTALYYTSLHCTAENVEVMLT
jgi:hypothetical protein